eukprot:TRINITY_DN1439_c0_g2_i6.p1 TRINITY_DN1439_c0_g2~~TRINITY_DN1439_c0_g2_i6.p1  ORF type:complete len:203 (-),score=39.04 TRINITY_DN1439_c0_g2_i6:591-1199(-)
MCIRDSINAEYGATLYGTMTQDKCNLAFRLMNYLPPAIVTCVIGWPYYTYVFINSKILLEDEAPGPFFGYVCLVTIHVFMFFLLWSFAQSIMVDPGRVPEWFARLEMERQGMHNPGKLLSLPEEDVKKLQETLDQMGAGNVERKLDGSGRWCRKCVRVKPDRCHHCRVCQRCVPYQQWSCLTQVRAENGSPLPMDQQLCRAL